MFKKLLSSLLALSLLGASAYAATEIKVDPENETIVISGKLAENAKVDDVSVNILYPGKTIQDIYKDPQDALIFSAQFGANQYGSFEITAKITGESGVYTVYTDYEGNTDKKGKEVMFVTLEDNIKSLTKLVRATSVTDFLKVLSEEAIYLNLSEANAEGLDKEGVAGKFLGLAKEADLKDDEIRNK